MHPTTYGATHKIEICEKKSVLDFLEREKNIFEKRSKVKSCIYSNKKVISNPITNYLNEFDNQSSKKSDLQLKNILRKEYDECEKLYPYLGEMFLSTFFDQKTLNSKKINLFTRETCDSFFKTSTDKNAINISKWIIENSSPDRAIDIKSSLSEEIQIFKEDDIFIKVEYDSSFLGSKKEFEMKNYRFAIIDGFVESLGELHHMLHFAAESKEPYVIFCFGMSEEVKNVIIQNNSKNITQIFPVSMKIDENTANILNDFALLHKSDIISSLKGQTISQEMRKELKVGKRIVFSRRGITIDPLCDKQDIASHINFLKNRIENSPPDVNTSLIEHRIKNLRSKVLKIYVPEELRKDNSFNRELDYLLRMLTPSGQGYYLVELYDRKIMIPKSMCDFVHKKVNTTKEMFYNIEKIIVKRSENG